MKATFLFASAVLLLTACNNNETKKAETSTATTSSTTVTPVSTNIVDSTADVKGNKLYMAFDTTKSTVTVTFNGEKIEMKQDTTASGIRYSGNGYEYEEWHQEIRLRKGDKVVFENKLATENAGKNAEVTFDEPPMPENFIGPNGERMNVGYDTKGEKPVAHIVYFDDAMQTLTQTEASAKTAIYKNDKMTWEVNGSKGTLTVDGKKIKMSKAN